MLAAWEKREFNLATEPGKAVMSRIVNDPDLAAEDGSTACRGCSIYRRKGAKHVELESALYDWVCDMSNSRRCISGAIIQAKAHQLAEKTNNRLPSDLQITTQFSEGWLERFKKRWCLKACRLHGEAGDVDLSNIVIATDEVRTKIETYHLKDVFNCDERGCFIKWPRISPLRLQRSLGESRRKQASHSWLAAMRMAMKSFLSCSLGRRLNPAVSRRKRVRSWAFTSVTTKRPR